MYNSIGLIQDEDLSWKPNFPADFEQLIAPTVTDDDNAFLCVVPTSHDIKQSMFHMNSFKSPGLIAYLLFFTKNISLSLLKIWCLFKKFFITGKLIQIFNQNFISLIPKTDNLTKVDQFRPISLCNICYKIISKIIASRVKHILERIISPTQAIFVPIKSISDNSIIYQEVVHYMNRKKCKLGFHGHQS